MSEFDVQVRGDAAREARDRVVCMLRDWCLPLWEEILQAVRLCTSELVAIAVEHGGRTCQANGTGILRSRSAADRAGAYVLGPVG
jgi:hypothetical protein